MSANNEKRFLSLGLNSGTNVVLTSTKNGTPFRMRKRATGAFPRERHFSYRSPIKMIGRDRSMRHSCPVCGGKEIAHVVYRDVKGFDLVRCGSCKVVHLSPLPSEENIRCIYSQSYFRDSLEKHGYLDYDQEHAFINATYRRRFRRISTLLRPRDRPLRMHEIGCAMGFGLDVGARQFGWDVSGSDISAYAVERSGALGYPAVQSDSLGRCDLPFRRPDLICLFDVIEHLPRVHSFRDWLSGQMAPGALLAMTTMDMDSFWNRFLGRRSPSIKVPEHLTYFTTQTLKVAMGSMFRLVYASADIQTVSASLLARRILNVLGLRPSQWGALRSLPTVIPNGMKLYVFERT